jgi:ribose-phosphate pyrophosphokinase
VIISDPDRGELAIFSLPSSQDYANNVCRRLVELSNLRYVDLEVKLALFQELHGIRYLDDREAAEYKVHMQILKNLDEAALKLEELIAKYNGEDNILKIDITKGFKDEEIEDRLYFDYWYQIQANGGLAPMPARLKIFKDIEHNVDIVGSVAGRDAFLIAQVHDRKHIEEKVEELDKIVRDFFKKYPLLRGAKKLVSQIVDVVYQDLQDVIYFNFSQVETFLDALVRSKVSSITVAMPYLLFARGDRQGASEAITARIALQRLSNAGASMLLPIDLHAGQVRGFIDPKEFLTENLYMRYLFEEHYLKNYVKKGDRLVIAVPDAGAGKLGERYAFDLHASGLALGYKVRSYSISDFLEKSQLLGDVDGAKVLLVDDEFDTGKTLKTIIDLIHDCHAKEIVVALSHAKLTDEKIIAYFDDLYKRKIITKVLVGDTIPHSPQYLKKHRWLEVIDTSVLTAEAIYSTHCNLSMSEMYERQIKNNVLIK